MSVLFAVFGSEVDEETVAVLLRGPLAGAAAVSVIAGAAPGARFARVQTI